jgi:hypothetical protein
MKVDSEGLVRLTGPLSRNDRLTGLKIGDRLDVRILERTGPASAIIDLRGNKVHAQFTRPLPARDRIVLVLIDVKSDCLRFSLDDAHSTTKKIDPFFLRHFDFRVAAHEKTQALLRVIRTGVPSLFQLSMLYGGFEKSDRAEMIRRVMRHFAGKDTSRESLMVASALLSGFSEEETAILMRVLSIFGNRDWERKKPADGESDRSNQIDEILTGGMDAHGVIMIPDGESEREIEFIRSGISFAGKIETPNLGIIEFRVTDFNGLDLIFVSDEPTREEITAHMGELVEKLHIIYGKIGIHCLTRGEWSEKVLAFAGMIGDRSFDVIA